MIPTIHTYMDSLGVETMFEDSGIRIRKKVSIVYLNILLLISPVVLI
ncbi:MAG: hypothetical protein IPG39_16285 [Bacteroidetes bacterium]|nr:hypothetical protein [Bacteroidota bacterium]